MGGIQECTFFASFPNHFPAIFSTSTPQYVSIYEIDGCAAAVGVTNRDFSLFRWQNALEDLSYRLTSSFQDQCRSRLGQVFILHRCLFSTGLVNAQCILDIFRQYYDNFKFLYWHMINFIH